MKKIVLVLTIALSATSSFAQTSPAPSPQATVQQGPVTPAQRADRLTKMMTEQLALTADQSAKIKEINLQRVTEQQAFRQKQQSDREAMRKEMRTLQEKYTAQYKAILTPEQYTKYESQFKGDRMGNRGPGRGPGQSQSQR